MIVGAEVHRADFGHRQLNILPGFMMPLGSSACLTERINSTASPNSSSNHSCLPRPIPCSPVHVPSISSALIAGCPPLPPPVRNPKLRIRLPPAHECIRQV